ncbi:MAG: DUF2948 family protein [Paracoccaceae bacterium]
MVEDARFEDAGGGPLHLAARDVDDLQVISTLVQDAVFPVTEMNWDQRGRRFALLLNRFRWEDVGADQNRKRDYERVQAVLVVNDVLTVSSQGVDRKDPDMIMSLLSLSFEPGTEGMGRLELTLAGDGAIALDVEVLDITLNDVTRPYIAPSRHKPSHG